MRRRRARRYTVTVNAVDANWNLVTSSTHTVGHHLHDPNATLPANAALVGGNQDFQCDLQDRGQLDGYGHGHTLMAPGRPTPARRFTVNAGAFAKLQILVPGEIAAPGSATGKTGSHHGAEHRQSLHRDGQRGGRQLEPGQHRERHRRTSPPATSTPRCRPTQP